MSTANTEKLRISTDPLNVIGYEVAPLPPHVMEAVARGRAERTQLLDGSMLPQHEGLKRYAYTHVHMDFDNEDDLIRCVRMLQWSDERMRSRTDPMILWEWTRSYRHGMSVEFTVAWYSKDFFDERKNAFMDPQHASYYSSFGLKPSDIKIKHEIL